MAVGVTLATTTLTNYVGASDLSIKVASSSGLTPGTFLYIAGNANDRELMSVVSLGVSTSAYATVNVKRGVGGTTGAAHNSLSTVYIGSADQFYATDPVGAPAEAVLVSPWINAPAGRIWLAQGDNVPGGVGGARWWQLQTTTYGVGALGIRSATNDPTAST